MEIRKLERIPPILQPTYPKLAPEHSEQDYRESQLVNICEIATPEWDKASGSVNLLWLQALRELRNVTKQLKETRKKASLEYVKNDQKWRELQEKEEALRQSFVKFESFLIENEEKRKRATRKIQEDRYLQETRTLMAEEGMQQLKILTDVRQKFDQKIKEYRIYEDFLNKVVTSESKDFKTINDVIKRHVILLQTKDEVTAKRTMDMDAVDEAKTKFSKLIDEKDLEHMMLNSQLVELTVRHDRARNRALLWESTVMEIKDITEQKNRDIVTVKVAIWRMYKMMCTRKGHKIACAKDDLEGQMTFIKKGLQELSLVIQNLEKVIGVTQYQQSTKPPVKKRHIKIDKPKKKVPVERKFPKFDTATAAALLGIDLTEAISAEPGNSVTPQSNSSERNDDEADKKDRMNLLPSFKNKGSPKGTGQNTV